MVAAADGISRAKVLGQLQGWVSFGIVNQLTVDVGLQHANEENLSGL
jgi:hypothetical protein